ncbi:MAG: HAMP domain-containing protein [Alphaproteobacteria bacterium]|nr:HAMP domain-containing protein [Alphaproteobacteria bacterium]
MTSTPLIADAAPPLPPRRSKGAIGFAIGFALAAALTATAAFFSVSGAGPIGPASPMMLWMILASLAITAVLSVLLVHRIFRIARGEQTQTVGAKLHLKFVSLFSIAAVAPAVVVAVFLGAVLSRGVEDWFSDRVKSLVENGAAVGRYVVDGERSTVQQELTLMASDLNRAAEGLISDPETYGRFLAAQAEQRFLTAAYVIDGRGAVLARAETDQAPPFRAPDSETISEADRGGVADRLFQNESVIRGLIKLSNYDDAYLYAVRPIDPDFLARLSVFDESVAAYRVTETSRARLQTLFALSYLTTAFLVLLGAVWVGLSLATSIAAPIGRLAGAARRVASGDLKARVSVGADRDEVDALGHAFNQMTAQLDAQRRDLVRAQDDAESRSRFIQAVLRGVSAGVVGLDRDGRILAANTSAARLLGAGEQPLEGRRIIDVAPEFADLLNQPPGQTETPPQRVDIVREDGTSQLSVRMARDAEGGLVLTFDDMTKLIAAQRQEAWKDVARRIAHEIKNPLTPIQLSAERLRRKFSDEITSDRETFERCADTILRQVADIGRMVDEFNAFARMPAPRMAFADLRDTARDVVFAQRLAFADVHVEMEGADRPIPLVCDERLIGQALTNLIKNSAESVQARRARDGEPKDGLVTLRLRDLDYGVQFEVIDNGLGFPAQDRDKLIEPYVTTRTKGAGLGLAIVARIVEDHGGLIELDDAPGGPGAVVRFVLPKRVETPPDAAELQTGAH